MSAPDVLPAASPADPAVGPLTLAAATILVAAAMLTADATGLLRLGWGWAAPLMCLCAGVGLIGAGRPSRAMFVGALAHLTDRPVSLWSLRAATVATAPLAGLGPAAYALLALNQALIESGPRQAPLDWRRALGTGLVGLGFVLGASELGVRLGSDAVLWPVLLAAAGLSGFWWSSGPTRAVRRAMAAAAALVLFVWAGSTTGDVDGLILAGIGGAVAITLVVGPRWLLSSRALAAERARRARYEERAEVAELVHDSVLQTLALIQSRADDPAEVKALARRQERDLRTRLFAEGDGPEHATSIATALRAVAAEVEDAHRVKIEAVTVGDAPLDEHATALVAAAREALFNAAKHAPGAPVSLFLEVDDRRVDAYVRDRGPGFDLERIPGDRRGVTDSIVARMVRHGGHAAVRTAPGGGCEVRLVLERAG